MSASGPLVSIASEVPVTSPNLPIYPTIENVVLKGQGYGVTGNGSLTTSGGTQLIAEIPVSALGVDLLTSSKALLTLETSQENSAMYAIGCSFAVGPTDISNVTSVSRNYGTNFYPVYFTTSTSLVLSRELDYPAGTSNISVWMAASTDPAYIMSTSNALGFSYTLTSIA